MRLLFILTLLSCCYSFPLSAQIPHTRHGSLKQRVESVLMRYGIDDKCLIQPTQKTSPHLLEVKFLNKMAYSDSDLAQLFNYLSTKDVGISIVSLDLGRPDDLSASGKWRPVSFQVRGTEPVAKFEQGFSTHLRAIRATLNSLKTSNGAMSIHSWRVGKGGKEHIVTTPAGSVTTMLEAEKALMQIDGVALIECGTSIAPGTDRAQLRLKISFESKADAAPPATPEKTSRLDIGLWLLETAKEFEFHNHVSVIGASNASGLIHVRLAQKEDRDIESIRQLILALERCHPSLRLSRMNLRSKSIASDAWNAPSLSFDVATEADPKQPSMRPHLLQTLQTLELLGHKYPKLSDLKLNIYSNRIRLDISSSSNKVDWIGATQQMLGGLPKLQSISVDSISSAEGTSEIRGIDLKFERPHQELENLFRSSLEGSKATVGSVAKNDQVMVVKLTVRSSLASGLILRLHALIKKLNAKSMNIVKAGTTKELLHLTVSYALK